MEHNEIDNEISLMEIWNKIWKNKFLIIIITGALVVLGTLGLYMMNKSGRKVETKVNYYFLSSNQERFADGTVFNYRDLLSLENLELVKASNAKFKDVDVESMFEDESTLIIKDKDVNNKDEVIATYFRISLPSKYFNHDDELLEEFIKTINVNLLDKAREKTKNHGIHNYFNPRTVGAINDIRVDYKDATYAEIFSLIRSQNELLQSSFNSILESNLNAQVDDVRLDFIQKEYSVWFKDKMNLDLLEREVKYNNFYNNGAETERLANIEISKIDRQYNINETIIEQLNIQYKEIFNNGGGGSIIDAGIFAQRDALISENVVLDRDRDDYKNLIKAINEPTEEETADNNRFTANLFKLINDLSDRVEEYNEFYIKYIDISTRYDFVGDKEFEVVKPYNMILMIVVLGMIGGIAGVTTALIKENINDKKELVNETK